MSRRAVPAVPAPGPFLTVEDVCALIHIRQSALYDLRRADPTFPKPRLIGRQKYLFVRAEVLAYVENLPLVGETVRSSSAGRPMHSRRRTEQEAA